MGTDPPTVAAVSGARIRRVRNEDAIWRNASVELDMHPVGRESAVYPAGRTAVNVTGERRESRLGPGAEAPSPRCLTMSEPGRAAPLRPPLGVDPSWSGRWWRPAEWSSRRP